MWGNACVLEVSGLSVVKGLWTGIHKCTGETHKRTLCIPKYFYVKANPADHCIKEGSALSQPHSRRRLHLVQRDLDSKVANSEINLDQSLFLNPSLSQRSDQIGCRHLVCCSFLGETLICRHNKQAICNVQPWYDIHTYEIPLKRGNAAWWILTFSQCFNGLCCFHCFTLFLRFSL